ncbi:MAG: efflux RND transporter periplasmic adaptor subunit [Nitrospiria bacterium]
MKRPFQKFFFFLVLPSMVFAAFYTFRDGGREAIVHEASILVKRGDVIVKAAEIGSLEPTHIVEIKSEQSGEVKQILVEAGDTVSIGQALATIQQESNQARQVAEARAAIEQERLNLKEAEREYQRMEELFKKGFVAKKTVEDAEKDLENAHIRTTLAKRNLLLTLSGNKALFEKVLAQDLSSDTLENFTVLSPLSGRVLEVSVNVGEIVSSGTSTVTGGTALMRIADLSNMWIKTKINEVNISKITEGQPAEVRLDAIPGKVYEGRVVKIAPKGEKEDDVVTYEITIGLANSDHRLMPSMTANVDIVTEAASAVLYLPLAAVTEVDGKASVRLKTATGAIETRTVGIGLRNESDVVITQGLNEGDRVLLPGQASERGDGRA